ncbi:MAG: hypothetical protein F6K30_30555, partial [Cyanothece sp. SIO2G6]|nr:hypothetical protein [Cyanothece sp. SIO2G6]
ELRHDDPRVKDAFDDHFLTGIANQLGLNHAEVLAGIDESTQAIRQVVREDGSLTRAKLDEFSDEVRGYFDRLLKPADALPEAALKPTANWL